LAFAALSTVHLSVLGAGLLVGLVLMVTWVDLRRNTELLLYANLAVSPARMSLVIVGLAVSLEVVIGLLLSALALPPSTGLST
jgi:hypothetical protein